MQVATIICAAGRSERFAPGTSKKKLEQDLGGRPVFIRSIEAIANRSEVSQVLLAVDPDLVEEFRLRYGDAVSLRGGTIVAGGRLARWETVRNALEHVRDDSTHIAVHDAARPLVSEALLDRLFRAAVRFEAVVPGMPVTSTLKRVDAAPISASEDDDVADAILGMDDAPRSKAFRVVETVEREQLYVVQTPQVFARPLLARAYAQEDLDSTDDAMLIERLGEPVHIVEGDPVNIKITTEHDLMLMRRMLDEHVSPDRPAHLRF